MAPDINLLEEHLEKQVNKALLDSGVNRDELFFKIGLSEIGCVIEVGVFPQQPNRKTEICVIKSGYPYDDYGFDETGYSQELAEDILSPGATLGHQISHYLNHLGIKRLSKTKR